MVLGVATAFAETVPTSQTITNSAATEGQYTISVAEGDTHTYTVYQILTGSLIAGESKIGNPTWGADAKNTGTEGVEAFITSITGDGLTNVQINDMVEAQLNSSATGQGTVSAGSSRAVAPGYYLLMDTTENLPESETRSLNIVAVFNNITITPKKDTPKSEKHVDDVNDSTGDSSTLKDSADHDVGDTVSYTLTFTLPADYANYKKYYVNFVDDMSAGLTYNNDAHIWFGEVSGDGTAVTLSADSSARSAYDGGTVYKYSIDDLKTAQPTFTSGTITIKYTATLNKDAVVGSAGNPNQYQVEFSRNPNDEGDGKTDTGKTPWDTNIVFTYKTVFNKVDGEGKPLTGADFTLYKWVKDDSKTETYKDVKGSWVDVTTLHTGDNKPYKKIESLTNTNGTADAAKFTFSGIDDGYYKLVENQTPTGYNTIADKFFTITATHDLESTDPKLTALTGTDGAQFTMTPSVPDGSLTSDIENNQGAVLPSTGGIGTQMFYIGGGLLALIAVILLVTKRRVGSAD